MELRVLKYFVEAARDENITKAAARLHVSQSSLTRQLHNLEEEIGKKLYTRSNYKIILTPEGLLLKKHAQEMLELEEKILLYFKDLSGDISGVVYIGAGETAGMALIGKILKNLINNYPKIKYRMISADREGVSEKLDRGLIDFGVFVGKVNLAKYNYKILDYADRWGVLVLKDDILALKGFAEPEDLLNRDLLASYQAIAENEFESWLGYEAENLNIIGLHNLIYNGAVMAREGLGILLTIEGIINTDFNSDFRFVPLKPEINARLALAWKKDAAFSKAAQKFLEFANNI
ncbi:MAG: LysR family transcriptional regulator [Synergistaceae bacterium]|nr:LysR family transcriptional regulator [Synergistaceae bacterium]